MTALDGWSLNGLELNDASNYGLEAVDLTPPAKRSEWATSLDSDGADLIRESKYENRVITMRIRVNQQATMDLALAKVGAVVDMLQECEKNPEGLELAYTPASGSKKVKFYVLQGSVTKIPLMVETNDAGFFVFAPVMEISLTCKPFGYGEEEEAAAAKSIETGLSVVVITAASVKGDVPAEGRLVIKDTAKVGRRYVEWGLEQRYYNASTSLILDSHSMTAVGGAGSEAAKTGAYKPSGEATIATTLLPEATICANTGVLKHVGTYRVKARVQAVLGSESVVGNLHCRLSYQDGEGPLRANDWQTPVLAGKFVEVDLGEIVLTPAITGTQKWLGQIEAYSTNTAAADVFHIDYLLFVPVLEGYGKARGQTSSASGTIVDYDNFTTGTLSGNLNTRTPAVGAAWATSGAATDWTVEKRQVVRQTKDTEPRYGVLGSAVGNSAITASFIVRATFGSMGGVILRWTNSSNYAFVKVTENTFEVLLQMGVVVEGVTTILGENNTLPGGSPELVEFTLGLTATLDGVLSGTVSLGGVQRTMSGAHSSLATGGALASGKGGIFEKGNDTIFPREFTAISVRTLPAIPFCIQSEKTMEVRSASTLTADSTGTYYGPPPLYRGSRLFVPQAGEANRTSRVIVKADRNDLEASDQQTIADAFTAALFATPRYLVIPR